jgi:subtilisin family serine protease
MNPLDLIKIIPLMERSSGSSNVKIGLIDGPVVTHHPDLVGEHLHEIPGNNGATCAQANSMACLHGTFVAGILTAKRSSPAPAICPNCTLLIRPIFAEKTTGSEQMPSATPLELAAAIIECIEAGARVITNSPCATPQRGTGAGRGAESTTVRRGVIVVRRRAIRAPAATITRHPGVIRWRLAVFRRR